MKKEYFIYIGIAIAIYLVFKMFSSKQEREKSTSEKNLDGK